MKWKEDDIAILVSEYLRGLCYRDAKTKDQLNSLVYEKPLKSGPDRPDILHVSGPSKEDYVTSVIEVEPTFDRAFKDRKHGVHQLARYKGNVKWLALPTSEYNPVIYGILEKSKVGLLLVDEDGVEELDTGNSWNDGLLLNHYPEVERFWQHMCESKHIFYWVRNGMVIRRC